MKKLILSSFAIVAFVFVSNSALAQETKLTVTIPTVTTLTVASGGTLNHTFTPAELTPLEAGGETPGKELLNAVTLYYASNSKTYIQIKATDFSDGDALSMPAGIIKFKTNKEGSSYTAMSNQDQLLDGAIGAGLGNAVGSRNLVVSYKITPDLTYAASEYTTTITYTITAN